MASEANAARPEFHGIYVDTNVLIKQGWPSPSIMLNNVFRFAAWWKIQILLPDAVIKEAEDHWLRDVKRGIAELASAQRDLQRLASPIPCETKEEHTAVEKLLEEYRKKVEETLKEYAIIRVPFTKRTTEEVFGFATKYILPFVLDAKGKGFQDVVILLSILDHLNGFPEAITIFISGDNDFNGVKFADFISGFILCHNKAGVTHPAMTESEYWEHVQSVSMEVEDALTVFHTYEEIHKLSLQNDAVFRAFNSNALLWKVQAHSLMTTLFVTLSRIFDRNPNTLSIHRLLNETLQHLQFFSKDALRKRKNDLKIGPEYLDALIDEAWAPADASELRYLKKTLAPHVRKFQEIYLPIRHVYYAHRVLDEPVGQLFSLTNRNELGKVLNFLHEMADGITHLYLNGMKPEFGNRDFTRYNEKIRASVREVVIKVTGLKAMPEAAIL